MALVLRIDFEKYLIDPHDPVELPRWLRGTDEYIKRGTTQIEELAEEVGVQPYILKALRGRAAHYPSVPLDPDNGEIRLLTLLPGAWDDKITCTLETVLLSNEPFYNALSYTWGVSTGGKTVSLNEVEKFPVTDNVEAALRRLRGLEVPLTVWIDSMCINQSDLIERGQQVSLMGRIYKQADTVIVWLGDHGIDDTGAAEQGFGDEAKFQGAMNAVFWHARPRWWERSWILQEIALASKAVVHFGPFQKRWGDFLWEVLGVNSSGHSGRSGNNTERDPIHLRRTQRWESSGMLKRVANAFSMIDSTLIEATRSGAGLDKPPSLARMLDRMKDQDCGDARDKIFSILNIIDPTESCKIRPDYTMPLQEVYARTTFVSIQTQGSFEVLILVRFWQDSVVTWVPTWSLDFRRVNAVGLQTFSKYSYHLRWLGQSPKGPISVSLSADCTCLTAQGVQFDVVTDICLISEMPIERADSELVTFLCSAIGKTPQEALYTGIGARCSR